MLRSIRMLLNVAAISLLLAGPAALEAQGAGVLSGQVYSADGRGVIRLRAFVVGAEGDTVAVGVGGDFALGLPATAGRIELAIDAEDRALREYHPVLATLDSAEVADGVRVVLIPHRWPIPAGSYAGRTVAISMDRAYTPACRGCPSFYRQGTPQASRGRLVNPESWPASSFPLRIAFDREHSRSAITARDSVQFWRTVEALEREFGEQLFRPENRAGLALEEGNDVDDLILVSIEPVPGQGYGSSVSQNGDIFYGAVRLRSAPLIEGHQGQRLVTHELMHTLGIGHTCAWRSVMAQVLACGGRASTTLSEEDVAYTQVLMRVRELQKAYGATVGIEAALAGERRLASPAAAVRP